MPYNRFFCNFLIVKVTVILCLLMSAVCYAGGQKSVASLLSEHVTVHGFLRQHVSMNIEDPIETRRDDSYDLSMVRSTFYLDLNVRFEKTSFTAITRFDWEYMTGYLRRLDRMTSRHLEGEYDQYDIRELYADLTLFDDRLGLRVGRQQVVWGKTDFFRGLDIIHGFDYRWRSFLEPENEQPRKPLILVNAQLHVPELESVLQVIIRPGLDRKKDIGNTYDAFGGRWSNQPAKGVNSLDSIRYNLEHRKGDRDHWTYGIRWSGRIRGIEYSLNYLYTFNNDPVVNPSARIGGRSYHGEPESGIAEFIYPFVHVAGGTANYYVAPLDIVLRGEFTFTWDQPYNYGQNFRDGMMPGFAGVIEKDTVRSMIAFDMNVNWVQPVFGACRPGFLIVQLFDTWIINYERRDDIVAAAGYGAHIRRHNSVLTAVLSWNYRFDTINPALGWGIDVQNGGGFVIPAIEFVTGDHWRLRVEYDWFYHNGGKKPGEVEHSARLFNFYDNNDQFSLRLAYQF
jgi:hypothetical protein